MSKLWNGRNEIVKMKTAVELLIEQIKSKADNLPTNTKENRMVKGIYVDCLMIAKQAKEMEKKQIIDAKNCWLEDERDGEQYYKEKYENNRTNNI